MLSELYRTEIEVLRVRDQIVVVGAHGVVESDRPHHLNMGVDSMDKLFDFGLTSELLGYDFVSEHWSRRRCSALLSGVLGPLMVGQEHGVRRARHQRAGLYRWRGRAAARGQCRVSGRWPGRWSPR